MTILIQSDSAKVYKIHNPGETYYVVTNEDLKTYFEFTDISAALKCYMSLTTKTCSPIVLETFAPTIAKKKVAKIYINWLLVAVMLIGSPIIATKVFTNPPESQKVN
jgi:hypothetical protein